MKKQTLISPERLSELEYKESVLYALEAGGVDNWQFYDECEIPDKSQFKNQEGFNLTFKEGDSLFYFNNECNFIGYVNSEYALINLVYSVSTDMSGENWCTPCNVGGMSTHKCSESQEVIDEVIDSINLDTTPFIIPVKLSDIRTNKFVIQEDKELREQLLKERKEVFTELSKVSVDIKTKQSELLIIESKIEAAKELEAELNVNPFEKPED